ncbi:GTPase [Bacillus sp. FJAT-42315]|uniref:GTPase n=1 Tax=Bacillus sp. FJAT-42315 TaxID=2014077 RepID=UPI000C249710|nr:GTPase [Bacillus sp. FJAT-42315]
MNEEKAFHQSVDAAFDEEVKKIHEQLDQDLLIVLVGEVNAGKSSTINKIIGKDVAKTNPQPGETVSIDPYNLAGLEKIKLMDTPGLNDPNDENPKKTEAFISEADIILFFTNAAGTVFSDSEKAKFQEIATHNENILIVLNKIDAAEDIESLVAFIKQHAGSQYDVVPISSKTGQNIDILKDRILELLEKKGKDILFAKSLQDKSTAAKRWINAAGVSAGLIGASPIPGSDVVPLTALQVGLTLKLATLYDKPLTKKAAKDLIIVTATKTAGQTAYRQIVKFIPGAGSIAGGLVASSLTLALGYGIKYAYENELPIDQEIIFELYKKYKKRKNYKQQIES